MAKNLKLHIKNVQIAEAINLRGLKAKLSKKKEGEEGPEVPTVSEEAVQKEPEKKKRTTKAKDKPDVAVDVAAPEKAETKESVQEKPKPEKVQETPPMAASAPSTPPKEESLKLGPVVKPAIEPKPRPKQELPAPKAQPQAQAPASRPAAPPAQSRPMQPPPARPVQPTASRPAGGWRPVPPQRFTPPPQRPTTPPEMRLGPVERPPAPPKPPQSAPQSDTPRHYQGAPREGGRPPYAGPPREGGRPPYGAPREGGRPPYGAPREGGRPPYGPPREGGRPPYRGPGGPGGYGPSQGSMGPGRRPMPFARPQPPLTPKPDGRVVPEKKEFTSKELQETLFRRSKVKPKEAPAKPLRKIENKEFEKRIRHGLRGDEEEDGWRKRRPSKQMRHNQEQEIVRPTKVSVRIPVSVKDLASEMKLKASQLISKLFLQGLVVTLNDMLADETAIQLLGHEFGCEIVIDTKEEERIRITDKSVGEEIESTDSEQLTIRPPVVAFMGHVDHGKTSLIDAIRKSNVAQHEVGAITQHIGAFRCHTSHGDIAILDTPGHEAFSHMRERGAEITDIVVLVIAGDEGIKQQTEEALSQAKASKATIVVAINKCDKPAFNVETVYRQLADRELLPEAWGGQTITVNTSAVTGQGINELLEMLAIQSEVLELRANPQGRARGTVIESEVEKGLGPVATVLVQNGTLRLGDSLVFGANWARIKTMKDEKGRDVSEAGPSTPVRINGLSGLPESGEEFIVVKSEREAREISQARHEGKRTTSFQTKKRSTLESMIEQAQEGPPKKSLTLIIRADVQGSAEALKNALEKIISKKVEVNIISCGVGQISESDVQHAIASKALILGFHTQIESHVESMIKEHGVQVRSHDIIYHAIDDVKAMMLALLDKIVQEKDVGKAEVKATFKSSQLGLIAGCQVADGTIIRNNQVRVMRQGKQLWKGPIASLKRNKDDVREVTKGAECGVLLQGFSDFMPGDILEAFEVIYLTQDL